MSGGSEDSDSVDSKQEQPTTRTKHGLEVMQPSLNLGDVIPNASTNNDSGKLPRINSPRNADAAAVPKSDSARLSLTASEGDGSGLGAEWEDCEEPAREEKRHSKVLRTNSEQGDYSRPSTSTSLSLSLKKNYEKELKSLEKKEKAANKALKEQRAAERKIAAEKELALRKMSDVESKREELEKQKKELLELEEKEAALRKQKEEEAKVEAQRQQEKKDAAKREKKEEKERKKLEAAEKARQKREEAEAAKIKKDEEKARKKREAEEAALKKKAEEEAQQRERQEEFIRKTLEMEAQMKWEEEEAARRQREKRERIEAEVTRKNLAEVQARQALAAVRQQAAREKRVAVNAAVAVLNDVNTRQHMRAALQQHEQKTTQLVTAMKEASTITATLRLLKELKAPMLRLRVHEILLALLIAGRYEDLLETDEAEEQQAAVKPPVAGDPKLEKLIKIIETRLDKQEKSNTTKQLEDYINTWAHFQLARNIKTPQEIDIEVNEMRNDWRRQKHSHIENLGFGLRFLEECLLQTDYIQSLNPSQKTSELKQLAELILDYLCDIADENSTIKYINQKGLNSSLVKIQIAIARRTEELVHLNETAWKYRVNAELIDKDMKRREILTNSILLGEEQVAKEHEKLMEELIQTASKPMTSDDQDILLPQLVEARVPRNQQNVRLEIVFEPSRTLEQKKEALRELEKILPGPTELRERPIITSPQADIHSKIWSNKEMLARLGVRAVVMGEYAIGDIKFRNRAECNRIYSADGLQRADGFISSRYFEEKRGVEPYFAPLNWRRLAINIDLSPEEFWDLYSDWPVAYHGTQSKFVNSILEQGFRPSTKGCFIDELSRMDALYLSPSIEYSGHPRYAQPVQQFDNKWVQVVLQVRVNPQLLVIKKKGTLPGAFPTDPTPADPHFKNTELEWLLAALPGTKLSSSDIVVSGIMLRVTDQYPSALPQTKWWGDLRGYGLHNYQRY